ncbi:MAG: DegV family protein, partial [Clostridiales bacterium]|nr:DegV family protein [Clostridiales bacterium]
MSIKITADSTCDLSQELIEKYNIEIVPLSIVRGDESLKDGVEISPDDIFDYVESGAGVCRTTAVNIDEYSRCFSEALKTNKAVIHFTISSEMSACYQNALIASEDFENVYVVDSRSLSTGIGHLVLDAAIMAEQGVAPREIYDSLIASRERLEVSFVLSTLKYIHKGGRCSAVAALGANLLQLKPCIEVKNGKMDVGKKYRGSFEKCIMQYVDEKLRGREDLDLKRIFVTSTANTDKNLREAVIARIRELADFDEIYETTAG